MARFELPIYGKEEEQIKKYETDHVRWGVLVEAIGLQEELKGKEGAEVIAKLSNFMKTIFPDLTDEDLNKADYFDIVNTFNQLANVLKGLKVDEAKKD